MINAPRTRPWSALAVTAIGIALTIVDFVVAARAGTSTYGGAFLNAPGPAAYTVDAGHNLAILLFAGCGWLLLVASVARQKLSAWAVWSVVLLLVPQILLYSRQGILEGKYELPGALAIVGAGAVAVSLMRPALHRVGVWALAIPVGLFAVSTWTYAAYFTADSQLLHAAVQRIATTAPEGATVGIAGDPTSDYEPMLAMIDQFAAAGRPDLQLKALVTPTAPTNSPLAQQLLATQLGRPTPLQSCDNLAAIVVLNDPKAARAALSCLDTFTQADFTEQVLLWGGDQVSLRPRLPGPALAGYHLLLRQATAT
jgi:hypothetical protein